MKYIQTYTEVKFRNLWGLVILLELWFDIRVSMCPMWLARNQDRSYVLLIHHLAEGLPFNLSLITPNSDWAHINQQVEGHSFKKSDCLRKLLHHPLLTYPVCIRVPAPDPENRMGYGRRLDQITDITLICLNIKVHRHHTGSWGILTKLENEKKSAIKLKAEKQLWLRFNLNPKCYWIIKIRRKSESRSAKKQSDL